MVKAGCIVVALAAIAALLAGSGAFAGPSLPPMSVGRLAAQESLGATISTGFVDAPLADVVGFLQQKLGINIVLDPNCVQGNERLVTLQLRDVVARDALDLIMTMTGLSYSMHNGVLLITTPDQARRADAAAADLRIYDVRDFQAIASVAGSSASSSSSTTGFSGSGNNSGTGNGGMSRSAVYAGLLQMIVEFTGPENWRSVGILGATSNSNEEQGFAGGTF